MSRRSRTVASIDIGTSKISVTIGEVTRDGIDIIGTGSHPSLGIKKGRITGLFLCYKARLLNSYIL